MIICHSINFIEIIFYINFNNKSENLSVFCCTNVLRFSWFFTLFTYIFFMLILLFFNCNTCIAVLLSKDVIAILLEKHSYLYTLYNLWILYNVWEFINNIVFKSI